MNKEIEIPEGYEARIESNKVVLIPKESEDEKIRKKLIRLVQDAINKTGTCYTEEEGKPLLAWLEKQKEQKSLNVSAASEWLRKHVRLYMNSEYNEFHKCVEYDGNIDEERLINDFEEAMQKEQQPAEKQGIVARLKEHLANTPKEQLEAEWKKLEKWNHVGPTVEEYFRGIKPAEWSEEDELMRKRCIADLGYLTEYEPQYKERYDAQIDWLKSICLNLKKRNEDIEKLCSNEWSEEDERNLQLLSAMCDDIKGNSATYSTMYREMEELKTWLECLHERFNLQPKQEWSEEEEKMLWEFTAWIPEEELVKHNITRKDILEKLKSLRPQWKPSEEQKPVVHENDFDCVEGTAADLDYWP